MKKNSDHKISDQFYILIYANSTCIYVVERVITLIDHIKNLSEYHTIGQIFRDLNIIIVNSRDLRWDCDWDNEGFHDHFEAAWLRVININRMINADTRPLSLEIVHYLSN